MQWLLLWKVSKIHHTIYIVFEYLVAVAVVSCWY